MQKCFARQMLFPRTDRDDSSSSSLFPLPETCKLWPHGAQSHEFGCLEEPALPCPMMQPGNGPFRLRQGGIPIGEAHVPRLRALRVRTLPPALRPGEEAMVRGSEVRNG